MDAAESFRARREEIQSLLTRAVEIEDEADALDPDAIAILPTANNLRLRAMCLHLGIRLNEETASED